MESSPRDPRRRPAADGAATGVVITLAILLGLALSWHTTGDLDLPLHDRTGRDILDGSMPPSRNLYSFTAPEHRWVDHEWLFQVTVAAAGNLAGAQNDLTARAVGWHWLRLVLTAALLVSLVAALRPHPERGAKAGRWPVHGPPGLLAGPVLLITMGMLWTRLVLRPELASYALLPLLLLSIEAALRSDGPATPPMWRRLMDPRLPGGRALLLTLVWHQWHGFAAVAPILWLLAGVSVRSGVSLGGRMRLALPAAALALVAAALTPAGFAGLAYPATVLAQWRDGGPDLAHTISEMVPLLQTRGSLAMTLVVFKASLVWGVIWIVLMRGAVSPLRAILWLLGALAAWQGQRHLGLYALTFAMLHGDLCPAADTLWSRLGRRLPQIRGRRWRHAAGGVAAAMVTAVVIVAVLRLADDTFYLREGVARRWGSGITPATYPLDSARLLAAAGPLRVANNVDAASTLVFAGAGPVAIDGRTEVYPAATWRQYAELKQGGDAARRRLAAWRVDAVCLAHRNPAAHALLGTLLQDDGWTVVSADPDGIGFQRRAGDRRAALADALARGNGDLRAAFAAAPPGRDVRLADRAASWAALLNLSGQAPVAEEFLVQAAARCEDHPVVLHNLGNLLLARGEAAGALRRFERAAALNPAAAPPLVNAGTCLFRLGRLAEAADSFAAAVGRDPANFEGWANLAEARRQLGDRDGAREAYAKALALRPGDRRLRARAQSL
jgi:tetratricopeptide (TPR) repeat protein